MATLQSSCDTCYPIEAPYCVDEYLIKGVLAAETEYTYKITDRFGKVYTNTDTTDENGTFTIPIADFPDGFFSAHSGVKTLQFFADSHDCPPVEMTICEETYTCISITNVEHYDKTYDSWDLLCNCDGTPVVAMRYFYAIDDPSLPGGAFWDTGDTTLMSITINGVDYPLGGGVGVAVHVGPVENYIPLVAAVGTVATDAGFIGANFTLDLLSSPATCFMAMIAPEGSEITFNYTFTNVPYGGSDTINRSVQLTTSLSYQPMCYYTEIDISLIPTCLVDGAAFGTGYVYALHTSGNIGLLTTTVCERMDNPNYWATIDNYTKQLFGSQASARYTAVGPSLVGVTLRDIPLGTLITSNPSYVVQCDAGCMGDLGNTPYSWSPITCPEP